MLAQRHFAVLVKRFFCFACSETIRNACSKMPCNAMQRLFRDCLQRLLRDSQYLGHAEGQGYATSARPTSLLLLTGRWCMMRGVFLEAGQLRDEPGCGATVYISELRDASKKLLTPVDILGNFVLIILGNTLRSVAI